MEDKKSSLVVSSKPQEIEKLSSSPENLSAVRVNGIVGLKEKHTDSSTWTIANRAYQKFKTAGMDKADIRNVLEKRWGCRIEVFQDILPVKKIQGVPEEIGIKEGAMVYYSWTSYNPDTLLSDPEALKEFERLTISKSHALSQGSNGVITLRGIVKAVEAVELLEIDVLVADSSDLLEENPQDQLKY